MQIARSSADVFSAFARLEQIPQFVRSVVSVVSCEDVSVWIGQIDGRRFEWDVEILQVVPKQVIGWKSYRGPKHSGRLSFFSVGDHTLVHVEMNYVPRIGLARVMDGISGWNMGDAIAAALRDIKTTLESTSRSAAPPPAVHETHPGQATGTYGPGPMRRARGPEPAEPPGEIKRPPKSEYP
jgi:uncharacterized membrane protein